MIFGKQTHKKTVLLAVALCVSVPLGALSRQSDQLRDMKGQFDELWHSAAETTKRRASLEQNLAQFDTKVASAKRDLEKAAMDRRDNRLQILERQKLIEVLNLQLHAAAESRGFYESVAVSQKDDIVSFIRYLSGREIALRESGPAVGGSLLKQILRGSLGESVDASLADAALLRTRRRFSLQVDVLVSEADRAEKRIREVLGSLMQEVDGLEERGKNLSQLVEKQTALIDDSWRKKQLSQEELQSIIQEAQEVNARIGLMQASLLQINAELREETLSGLRRDLAAMQSELQSLQETLTTLQRKDQAMSLLLKEGEHAFEEMQSLRNTDKKIYKRIEESELLLQQKERDLRELAASSSGAEVLPSVSSGLQSQIDELRERIALMKTGVPEDAAKQYVQKRVQSEQASVLRRSLATEIADVASKVAALEASIRSKEQELKKVEDSSELNELPPLFQWPVAGPVTAGYFDPDYLKVFNVPHKGIDIATPQATPIRTVSQGIVFAVKDGGRTGYSYILIGHQNGYASLYGHVSASFVKAGDKVGYGHIIGLSGGQPGTHGAGHMTTGAHLHLEMMKNGAHLNPLGVLSGR